MSVDAAQPTRLLVTTSAGPVEVAAAASAAALAASDVFSADIREERALPGGVDLVVTPPLAHAPALRLQVTWVQTSGEPGPRWSVGVDVVAVDASACGDRARRTDRAVERFVEVLASQLAR